MDRFKDWDAALERCSTAFEAGLKVKSRQPCDLPLMRQSPALSVTRAKSEFNIYRISPLYVGASDSFLQQPLEVLLHLKIK